MVDEARCQETIHTSHVDFNCQILKTLSRPEGGLLSSSNHNQDCNHNHNNNNNNDTTNSNAGSINSINYYY